MNIYNSLSRRVEKFESIEPGKVRLYTCGPTVYWSTHLGHMSKYVGDDLLKRTLTYNGYEVLHVMNITDVGHLTSDGDEGEDKMEKGATREGLSVWDIAKKYEAEFFTVMDELNVLRPVVVARATQHINDQINLITQLQENDFTYETDEAIYFDVVKFPDYWKLAGQNLSEKKVGVRPDVVVDKNKKNPYDFVLWFKAVGRFKNHVMRWKSPWGEGFPGWHIECSAMSMKYLGETIDIHTGGIDHLGVHHPAEIAQSQAATGKTFVNYWLHHDFITVEGQKMSKSLGNFYTLKDIIDRGYNPLALRYLFLTAHYRTPLNFTWEGLTAAQTTLNKLYEFAKSSGESKIGCAEYEEKFLTAINNDLNFPQALSVVWDLVKSDYPVSARKASLFKFDQVLGLGLMEKSTEAPFVVPEDVAKLIKLREEFRQKGDYIRADEARKKISDLGYLLKDAEGGPRIKKLDE